ncbi:hypothetical protein [Saccharothrix texasensis]|uniref:Uncharacterized protein n=1 Tax=Saccharothrix texasensis TaxID=103734 RepID=A0A3N1H168_9PSEU|nr:hypothetical protein [Saccharothrix texasensis]ROP36285.1 hypothetical protein EDD40_1550 [Saccharothrix texasensis]
MVASRIPAALDALVALCQGATATGGVLAGVQVVDGPPVVEPTEQLVLYIGDTPDDDSPGAVGAQNWVNLGGSDADEAFTIYCTALARSGDTGIKAKRDRAFGIYDGVAQLLRLGAPGADPRLGGSVLWARTGGEESYLPMQTDKGALVEVGFHVVCQARI